MSSSQNARREGSYHKIHPVTDATSFLEYFTADRNLYNALIYWLWRVWGNFARRRGVSSFRADTKFDPGWARPSGLFPRPTFSISPLPCFTACRPQTAEDPLEMPKGAFCLECVGTDSRAGVPVLVCAEFVCVM